MKCKFILLITTIFVLIACGFKTIIEEIIVPEELKMVLGEELVFTVDYAPKELTSPEFVIQYNKEEFDIEKIEEGYILKSKLEGIFEIRVVDVVSNLEQKINVYVDTEDNNTLKSNFNPNQEIDFSNPDPDIDLDVIFLFSQREYKNIQQIVDENETSILLEEELLFFLKDRINEDVILEDVTIKKVKDDINLQNFINSFNENFCTKLINNFNGSRNYNIIGIKNRFNINLLNYYITKDIISLQKKNLNFCYKEDYNNKGFDITFSDKKQNELNSIGSKGDFTCVDDTNNFYFILKIYFTSEGIPFVTQKQTTTSPVFVVVKKIIVNWEDDAILTNFVLLNNQEHHTISYEINQKSKTLTIEIEEKDLADDNCLLNGVLGTLTFLKDSKEFTKDIEIIKID